MDAIRSTAGCTSNSRPLVSECSEFSHPSLNKVWRRLKFYMFWVSINRFNWTGTGVVLFTESSPAQHFSTATSLSLSLYGRLILRDYRSYYLWLLARVAPVLMSNTGVAPMILTLKLSPRVAPIFSLYLNAVFFSEFIPLVMVWVMSHELCLYSKPVRRNISHASLQRLLKLAKHSFSA